MDEQTATNASNSTSVNNGLFRRELVILDISLTVVIALFGLEAMRSPSEYFESRTFDEPAQLSTLLCSPLWTFSSC
uniref:DUF1211 domain-containing protein n=1 Tax=Macrostomum lignano TaxID=282301 RepID=A0A1I8IXZ6_9PLAT